MAAETVGLAASVAGLLSLGLQITGGIVKYLDAFESRQEELASVKQQNHSLTATLLAVEKAISKFQQCSPEFTAAVSRNVESCEEELKAVGALLAELSNDYTDDWKSRLGNKTKRLTYAFHRSKVQQLAERLQRASEFLQLSLTGLGLEVSSLNTDILTTIESSAQDHSSGLLLVHSQVAAVEIPITDIRDRLPVLQDRVQESSDAVRQDIRDLRESIQLQSRQQQERFQQLESLLEQFRQGGPILTNRSLVRKVASKPAALRELCDNLQTANQIQSQALEPERATAFPGSLRSTSLVKRVCICPQPVKRKTLLGYASAFGKWETKHHWPSCPLAKRATEEKRLTIGLRYTGLARILQSAVEVSFSMTSGAGGCSFGPNFTYRPTVDDRASPAFRIIHLMSIPLYLFSSKNIELFMGACLRKLIRLFDEGRASPVAVNVHNQSLMHRATSALSSARLEPGWRLSDTRLFVELVRILLSYGVPAITYDSIGHSPLMQIITECKEGDVGVLDVLVRANTGGDPIVSYAPDHMVKFPLLAFELRTRNVQSAYDISPDYAEVNQCGPLSMAIVRNDVDQVSRILSRFPESLSEIDTHGQTPLHLATTKSRILALLLQVANASQLDKRDKEGISALEASVLVSSRLCINGTSTKRCNASICACTQCPELLIRAGCNIRMRPPMANERVNHLGCILRHASELARRIFVYYMSRLRSSLTRGVNTRDMGWVFTEIDDPKLADIFYRYGFRPGASCFLYSRCRGAQTSMDHVYFSWLVEHGGDLFFRLTRRPPAIEGPSNIGLFTSHLAFFCLELDLVSISSQGSDYLNGMMESMAMVLRRNLADECHCHCTVEGCSPFTWMMKGTLWMPYSSLMAGHIPPLWIYTDNLESYYSKCGPEITMLSYSEAIRYATFDALSLVHTCCNPGTFKDLFPRWIHEDDCVIINEEQAYLLGVHERLVAELEEMASGFLGTDSNGLPLFPRFWSTCWRVRVEEELAKINGRDLTDSEKRGAEDLGVQWQEQEVKEDDSGSCDYEYEDVRYHLHQLDQICPDLNEPWPEGLHRISRLG